jgi:Leucine-rich repeat (LRR) protein
MLSKTNLSDDYLKSVTGFFDLEIIFDLELTQKNIVALGSLPKCVSLVYLDLSQNKISDITEIDTLVELKFLDLSFNNISNITPLGSLLKLRNLKLQGNNINGPLPNILKNLKKLEQLTFKTVNFEENKNINVSNPICSMTNYRNEIFACFTNLKWLDNLPKGMEEIDCNYNDDEDDMINKIDVDSFKFNFNEEIKLDSNELISNEDIDNAKKEIQDKYKEYEKGIEELKKELAKIK